MGDRRSAVPADKADQLLREGSARQGRQDVRVLACEKLRDDLKHRYGADMAIHARNGARVPIVHCHLSKSQGRWKADVAFNNGLGSHKAKILLAYMESSPIIRELALLVKRWAKGRGLCGGRGLTSLGWVLLVIYYDQMRTPPLLPNLQQSCGGSPRRDETVTTYDFDKDAYIKHNVYPLVDKSDAALPAPPMSHPSPSFRVLASPLPYEHVRSEQDRRLMAFVKDAEDELGFLDHMRRRQNRHAANSHNLKLHTVFYEFFYSSIDRGLTPRSTSYPFASPRAASPRRIIWHLRRSLTKRNTGSGLTCGNKKKREMDQEIARALEMLARHNPRVLFGEIVADKLFYGPSPGRGPPLHRGPVLKTFKMNLPGDGGRYVGTKACVLNRIKELCSQLGGVTIETPLRGSIKTTINVSGPEAAVSAALGYLNMIKTGKRLPDQPSTSPAPGTYSNQTPTWTTRGPPRKKG
ncbi:unnamed protein product [Vitrella brassicaformis CCMP3155]|uniref:PAP-associated domain-containing protein n=1 Tax=Vitrella brassicaformis (strain CCMP3155) TaxID=1169540 RepID=A0A0G4FSK1_VITBC|nr:unnamed protein product [Vitrella brassicaformis CCMP3155]|eukprot:CEM17692.1 unnamed protein product [Vitrella brassicaformis CCMP3155]